MMSTEFKNATPNILLWRQSFLKKLGEIKPLEPKFPETIELSPGNSKTGQSGRFYKAVFVWNLPSVATCPEASQWCLKHCYNADAREDKFPVSMWAQNWWMAIFRGELLFTNIVRQLKFAEKPCAVRIHSSGDFFSHDYIRLWVRIAQSVKDTFFWAYTRSWAKSDLYIELKKLEAQENIQLFASWDTTMNSAPPKLWRQSFVFTDVASADAHKKQGRRAFLCPEQVGKVNNCASCGFCIRKTDKDILFYFH